MTNIQTKLGSRLPPGEEEESAAASWKVVTDPFTMPVRDPISVSEEPSGAGPGCMSHTPLISMLLAGATISPVQSGESNS